MDTAVRPRRMPSDELSLILFGFRCLLGNGSGAAFGQVRTPVEGPPRGSAHLATARVHALKELSLVHPDTRAFQAWFVGSGAECLCQQRGAIPVHFPDEDKMTVVSRARNIRKDLPSFHDMKT